MGRDTTAARVVATINGSPSILLKCLTLRQFKICAISEFLGFSIVLDKINCET